MCLSMSLFKGCFGVIWNEFALAHWNTYYDFQLCGCPEKLA